MRFCFQDPQQKSYNLHEELLLASIGATSGAGAFAFVTVGGVNLLLRDTFFLEFISGSGFVLIVGTDEITDTRTIETLVELVSRYPNLKVKAFLNTRTNAIFHPKYCWFRHQTGGVAIVGSGNLTQGGLRRNWEAFSVLSLTSDQVSVLENQWNQWFLSNLTFMRDLADPAVLARVAQNERVVVRATPMPVTPDESPSTPTTDLDEEFESWIFSPDSQVLLAEIPRSGDRWEQANFDKASFVDFFGATPGDNNLRVIFKGIQEGGEPSEVEVRQTVSVSSHNYRFELSLAKGKSYPSQGRPLGIFVKCSERNFLYMLKMPGDSGYTEILGQLTTVADGSVHRRVLAVSEVQSSYGSLEMWKYLASE
jgi:hypothetical protein